jgi:hypothetical protein
MTSGTPLALNLEPVDRDNRPLTFALSISIYGKVRWPLANDDATPIEVQLDDLFAYLVEFWRPLLLRQTYPFGLTPIRPSVISRAASGRWDSEPQELMDEEAEILSAFEEAHDLSRAFGGMFDLPHFWMLREGDRMVCDTGREFWRLPFDAVAAELAAAGDRIADYLMHVAPEKWGRVVDAWNRRDEIDDIDLVAWSAGVKPEVAKELIDRGAITAPASFRDAANDDDPLLIAARMAGELPTDQIVKIIEIAKSFDGHDAQRLDELSVFCRNEMDLLPRTTPAHGQGETVARELRRYLEFAPSDRIDIFEFASAIGIEIRWDDVEPRSFDGLAIAGGHYGPGAFINAASRRLGKEPVDIVTNGGSRVTLAHELCHLLLDRDHPLSAVEVLRSRMPAGVEARARAFAGEFLLPTSAASYAWQLAGLPFDTARLQAVLQELVVSFGVTFSVAAWKVEHGAGPDRHRLRAALDTIAPYR